jgi:hypothetical protein
MNKRYYHWCQKQKNCTFKEALTEAAYICASAKEEANSVNTRIVPGTYMAIIKETKAKYGLDRQSIKFDTINSRLFANNLTRICHQKTSPVDEVEPLIVDSCVALGQIGDACTKFEVLELADDILEITYMLIVWLLSGRPKIEKIFVKVNLLAHNGIQIS